MLLQFFGSRSVHIFATALIAIFIGIASASAASAPLMSLPGKLAVSSTGAASFHVPIAVPPGTQGMVPAISLEYSSEAGNSIVGFKWSLSFGPPIGRHDPASIAGKGRELLSLNSATGAFEGTTEEDHPLGSGGSTSSADPQMPSIQRCPRTLAQDSIHGAVNYDMNDRFCLAGQRLILISGTYGTDASEYRTEVETFAKVIAHGASGNGPAWFEVHTKDGLTLEYGRTDNNSSNSRLLAVGSATARLWMLDKVIDSKGNYFLASYVADQSNGQIYPIRMDYTGNATATLNTYNSVQFSYNMSRPDVTTIYQAGALQRTTVLLTNIKTYQGTNLVHDYQLGYALGSATRNSELTSLKQCGPTGACLPTLTFGWQGSRDQLTYTAVSNSLTQSALHFYPGDFNGDGLTDVILGSDFSVYLGTQAGSFTPANMTITGGGAAPIGFVATIFDINADGYSDFYGAHWPIPNGYWFLQNDANGHWFYPPAINIVINTGPYGYFLGHGYVDCFCSNAQSGFGLQSGNGDGSFTFIQSFTLPSSTFQEAIGDFDGDGCDDVLYEDATPSKSRLYNFCNAPGGLSSLPAAINSGTQVGDLNGDGIMDVFVSSQPTASGIWLSTARGFTQSLSLPAGWFPSGMCSIRVGDFNGDGKSDLLIVSCTAGQPHLVYLSSGDSLVLAASIPNSDSGISPAISAVVGDWNNDGASDIWIHKPSGDTEYLFSYVPELMTSISNGIGATATIIYDRLNRNTPFYSKGTGSAYPTQDIDNAMYVVKEIDTSNGIGANFHRTYAYSGAKTDLKGRGFLGFTTIAIKNVETGIVTTTSYRTDFPFIGDISAQSMATTLTRNGCTAGAILKSISNTFNATNLGGTHNFVFLQQSVASGVDCDGSVLPTTTTAYTYDAYGNPTQIAASVSDGSSSVTTSTFSNDTSNWLFLKTSNAITNTVGASAIKRTTDYSYFPGTDFLSQTIEEPLSSTLKLQTDYTTDAFGNPLTITVSGSNIMSRSSSLGYDPRGQFATSTTNSLNQVEQYTYDARFGTRTSHTDPNGAVTTWTFDDFGRPLKEVRPDGTVGNFSYAICGTCVSNGAFQSRVTPTQSDGISQNGAIITTTWDPLYRLVASETQSMSGAWIIKQIQYDPDGNVAQDSRPYFESGGTPEWTTYVYDDLARVTRAAMPDGSHTVHVYHGLSSSVTNDLNQTTTRVLNAQNLLASVTDASIHTASYQYDAFGNPIKFTDPSGNVESNTYDIRGHRIASNDPDLGSWNYVVDALGETTSQIDAKSQGTTFTYDVLGRLTQRIEVGLTSTWTWDTAAHGTGELASATTNAGYAKTLLYDVIGRTAGASLVIEGTTYTYATSYNGANGQIDTITYPSGLVVKNLYTAFGYLSQINNNGTGAAIATINSRDAENHLTQITLGNGISTLNSFDPDTGRLLAVRSGPSNSAASFDYVWDTIGNLTSRVDNSQGLIERFCYDNLNRLTNSAAGNSGVTTCTSSGSGITSNSIGYDAIGNIISKSESGASPYAWAYSYPAAGSALVHAVSTIAGTVNGVTNPSYTYDANGNMVSGAGRIVTWTSFNKATSIADGSTTAVLGYDADHNRIKQAVSSSTTYYLNEPSLGVVSEKVASSSATTWNDYMVLDGAFVAMHSIANANGAPAWGTAKWNNFSWTSAPSTISTLYFVTDQIGSISSITNDAGVVVERDSYDAWGRRRNLNGTDDAGCTLTSLTQRGFTGLEHMSSICEINANARIYDPTIARFMSPDTFVASPDDIQDWNDYSYVGNRPLVLTDPTGHTGAGLDSDHFYHPAIPVLPSGYESPLSRLIADDPSATCMGNCQIYEQRRTSSSVNQTSDHGSPANANCSGCQGAAENGADSQKGDVHLAGLFGAHDIGPPHTYHDELPPGQRANPLDPKNLNKPMLSPIELEALRDTVNRLKNGSKYSVNQLSPHPYENRPDNVTGAALPTGEYTTYYAQVGSGPGDMRVIQNRLTGQLYYSNNHYRSFYEITGVQVFPKN